MKIRSSSHALICFLFFVAISSGIGLSAKTQAENISKEMILGSWKWDYSSPPKNTEEDNQSEDEEDLDFTTHFEGVSVFLEDGRLREKYTLTVDFMSDDMKDFSPAFVFTEEASWDYDSSDNTIQISAISCQVSPINTDAKTVSRENPEAFAKLSDREDETDTYTIISVSDEKMRVRLDDPDMEVNFFRPGYADSSVSSTVFHVIFVISIFMLLATILVSFAKPEEKERSLDELQDIAKKQRYLLWMTLLSFFGIFLFVLYPVIIVFQIRALYKLGKTLDTPYLPLRCLSCIFPLLAVISSLVVSSYVNRILRKNGIRSGLTGARQEDIGYIQRTGKKIEISVGDRCPNCGTPLVDKTEDNNQGSKILISIILFIVCIVVIIANPAIGSGIGLGFVLVRHGLLKMLGQTKKWECPHCGYEIEHV